MIEKIGAFDAKTKLPEFLRRVESGESFTITHRGKPVADLVPSCQSVEMNRKSTIDSIIAAKKYVITNNELKALKEFGRK